MYKYMKLWVYIKDMRYVQYQNYFTTPATRDQTKQVSEDQLNGKYSTHSQPWINELRVKEFTHTPIQITVSLLKHYWHLLSLG